jgi:hypothetical protein
MATRGSGAAMGWRRSKGERFLVDILYRIAIPFAPVVSLTLDSSGVQVSGVAPGVVLAQG